MSARAPTIVFAAGGTGGHIYPALSIAQRLRDERPDTQVAFLCSERPIDARVLGATDELWTPIPAKPFGVKPLTLARFVWHWGAALRAARAVLKGADALVVTGGFVSPPAARAARVERVPVVLLNLDAVPGKASRLVSRRATCFTTLASDHTPEGWERLAPIVRKSLLEERNPGACRNELGLDPDTKTLFVTGGSQGARSLNESVIAFVQHHPKALEGWQALHQAGTGDDIADRLREAYDRAGVRAIVTPFVNRMDLAWHGADLAISRAGAGSVAEARATRTPTIFLPYPFHADDHQMLNARHLTDAGAALVITDRVDPSETLTDFAPVLHKLLTDDAERGGVCEALTALGVSDGARDLALRVLAIANASTA